jgi:phosphotransferase system enzyme I (PtsI)
MSREFKAVSVAPGIAIARVLQRRLAGEFIPLLNLEEKEVPDEINRFRKAREQAVSSLKNLMETLAAKMQGEEVGILGANLALLEDPGFGRDVEEEIQKGRINSEVAVQRIVAKYEQVFNSMDNPTLRQRAEDVRDMGNQILASLLERTQESLIAPGEDYILAVDEFLPSQLGHVDTARVKGILMGEGGKYSHGSILARSLGIPCLVGLKGNLGKIEPGTLSILDGDGGKVVVDPGEEELEEYRIKLEEIREAESRVFEVRLTPSVTTDGHKIKLEANAESLQEFEGLEAGVYDGVGLFRTEFAFMERLKFPSEEEQFQLYKDVLERAQGKRVTFRTLDVGGDKPLPYLRTPPEHNPVLGWRGIRLTLRWPDLFFTQMRALVRASAFGKTSILLPMVTNLQEVEAAKGILHLILKDLDEQGIPHGNNLGFGVMIEIPSLALMMDHLSKQVDFVSVGTNDLAQYLFAVDRDNPRVSDLYDPFHPGFLRFLAEIAKSGRKWQLPTTICGEIASETSLVPVLIGLGFRRLSMSPVFLPRIKLVIRSLDSGSCRRLARRILNLKTAEEVRTTLRKSMEGRSRARRKRG